MDFFAVYTGPNEEPRAWAFVGNTTQHTAAQIDRAYWCAVARLVQNVNDDIDRAAKKHGGIAAAIDAHYAEHGRGPYYGSLSVRKLSDPEFAQEQIAHCLKKPVVEITAERFNDLLCALPPLNWRGGGSFESFQLSESTCLILTRQIIRATIDGADRYFEADRPVKNLLTLSTLLDALK